MRQYIMCMYICRIACREVGRLLVELFPDKYNKLINILTCNFSKEQCTLPDDDLRIETCRSILSVLM